MADEAAWASWCLNLQPQPIFPWRVSGKDPAAAMQELSISPEAGGQETSSWGARCRVEMGSGCLQ